MRYWLVLALFVSLLTIAAGCAEYGAEKAYG